jgi:hypothetical protein
MNNLVSKDTFKDKNLHVVLSKKEGHSHNLTKGNFIKKKLKQ